MKKRKSREEWIKLFAEYDSGNFNWDKYLKTINRYKNTKGTNGRPIAGYWISQAKKRFIYKYRQWKLLDNEFMSKKKKRKTNKEIDDFLNDLTIDELKEIARVHIRDNEEKKNNSKKYKGLSISKRAFVLNIHRSTLYKTKIERKYKFDYLKDKITLIFDESKGIYGRRRLAAELARQGITIDPRTLGRYMNRWNLFTKTKKARKKAENKNTKVMYKDLVNRNFNPSKDEIVATDVSYIPADVKQNNVYLSVAISHKTKLIESWKLSMRNNNKLVIDTLNKLKRKNFILHSDHGSQYSSNETLMATRNLEYKTSMGRVGNSLDNREVEYFFGCLKGEYLKFEKTHKLSYEQVKEKVAWYINWYNTKRIQKRLQWKTPAEASAYAI